MIDQLLAAIDSEWLSTGDDRIENGARTNEPPSRARSATRLSIETQHLIIRRPNIVNIGGCLQRARSEWDTSPACPVLDISHPPADEFDAAPVLQNHFIEPLDDMFMAGSKSRDSALCGQRVDNLLELS